MADNTWRSNLRMPEADGETRVRFESSGPAFRVVVIEGDGPAFRVVVIEGDGPAFRVVAIEGNGRIDYSPWTPYAENLTFTF